MGALTGIASPWGLLGTPLDADMAVSRVGFTGPLENEALPHPWWTSTLGRDRARPGQGVYRQWTVHVPNFAG